jgi:hypothetical protein
MGFGKSPKLALARDKLRIEPSCKTLVVGRLSEVRFLVASIVTRARELTRRYFARALYSSDMAEAGKPQGCSTKLSNSSRVDSRQFACAALRACSHVSPWRLPVHLSPSQCWPPLPRCQIRLAVVDLITVGYKPARLLRIAGCKGH